MKCKITSQEHLKDLRVAHNLNLEELSKLTTIYKSALGNYENDDYKEINHANLVTLAQFYKVSTDYLFCLTENKNHPNTELTDLHLSDDMVDLLKSEAINNRLLCEIATHDKFKELMADTEIFVYGVATRHFNDLNTSLENVRTKIISQNSDIEEDIPLKTLLAAQISEEDFFCHVTHKTWDTILKDICKNHEHDIDSIPDADDILSMQKLNQIMKSSGNSIDKYIEVFCNSLGIKHKKFRKMKRNLLENYLKNLQQLKIQVSALGKEKDDSYSSLQLFNFNNRK